MFYSITKNQVITNRKIQALGFFNNTFSWKEVVKESSVP